MRTRHLFIFLIFFGHHCFAQSDEIILPFKYDPDTEQKLAMIYDTLRGDWLLKSKLTITKEKNDTLNKKIYNTSKSSSAASRPKIIFSFRPGGELAITEFPVDHKIIFMQGTWSVLVNYREGTAPFYLDLKITRSTEMTSYSNEFDGFIMDFDINNFQLKENKEVDKSKQWTVLNFTRL